MTQFYEGQEVEVDTGKGKGLFWTWQKGKIVRPARLLEFYVVELRDGTRSVLDEDHIRAAPLRGWDKIEGHTVKCVNPYRKDLEKSEI